METELHQATPVPWWTEHGISAAYEAEPLALAPEPHDTEFLPRQWAMAESDNDYMLMEPIGDALPPDFRVPEGASPLIRSLAHAAARVVPVSRPPAFEPTPTGVVSLFSEIEFRLNTALAAIVDNDARALAKERFSQLLISGSKQLELDVAITELVEEFTAPPVPAPAHIADAPYSAPAQPTLEHTQPEALPTPVYSPPSPVYDNLPAEPVESPEQQVAADDEEEEERAAADLEKYMSSEDDESSSSEEQIQLEAMPAQMVVVDDVPLMHALLAKQLAAIEPVPSPISASYMMPMDEDDDEIIVIAGAPAVVAPASSCFYYADDDDSDCVVISTTVAPPKKRVTEAREPPRKTSRSRARATRESRSLGVAPEERKRERRYMGRSDEEILWAMDHCNWGESDCPISLMPDVVLAHIFTFCAENFSLHTLAETCRDMRIAVGLLRPLKPPTTINISPLRSFPCINFPLFHELYPRSPCTIELTLPERSSDEHWQKVCEMLEPALASWPSEKPLPLVRLSAVRIISKGASIVRGVKRLSVVQLPGASDFGCISLLFELEKLVELRIRGRIPVAPPSGRYGTYVKTLSTASMPYLDVIHVESQEDDDPETSPDAMYTLRKINRSVLMNPLLKVYLPECDSEQFCAEVAELISATRGAFNEYRCGSKTQLLGTAVVLLSVASDQADARELLYRLSVPAANPQGYLQLTLEAAQKLGAAVAAENFDDAESME